MRMNHVFLTVAAVAAVAAVVALCAPASAEILHLTNGEILQGDPVDGQITDEGFALRVFDTDGVVVVKWAHIEESQRKELRETYGLEASEGSVEYVAGHRVLLSSGEWIYGVAENPRASSEPLRMRTRTGVRVFDRSALAGQVEDASIDGLLVYSEEELYQRMRDESPPETGAAHKALAQRCMNIGNYARAKEHIAAARLDPGFVETTEGKALDAMERVCDVMLRAEGAQDLVKQIKFAQNQNRHNDALELLNRIDAEYKDEAIRKAINFDNLEVRVVKARDTYFQRHLALTFYKTMEKLISAKAREQKPLRPDANAPSGAAAQGSIAAARQWANRELDNLIWDKLAADLGLKREEMETYWKNRTVNNVRRALYGTGSFIVVKKAAPKAGGGSSQPVRRRPPGSPGGGGAGNAPAKPAKVEKPATEEEWWSEKVGASDRERWLTAYFVESSGRFNILRTPLLNCDDCGGAGLTTSSGTDGTETQNFCKRCNGAGVFRTVEYR
jgi:hypothetical protein